MRVYISGAISGTDDYIDRFQKIEDSLSKQGMSVINPAKLNESLPDDLSYEDYMQIDFVMIDLCDGIYMMDGWQKSRGANREFGYALAKGMKIMYEGKTEEPA